MRWRFVDAVTDFSPWKHITTVKAGSFEEYGLLERWGVVGEAPAVLLLESLVQSAGWLVAASSDFTLAAELEEVSGWGEVHGLGPGERVRNTLTVTEKGPGHICFAAGRVRAVPGAGHAARHEGNITFRFNLVPLAERENAVEKQALWSEIWKEGA